MVSTWLRSFNVPYCMRLEAIIGWPNKGSARQLVIFVTNHRHGEAIERPQYKLPSTLSVHTIQGLLVCQAMSSDKP
jgi:hypothetical protein